MCSGMQRACTGSTIPSFRRLHPVLLGYCTAVLLLATWPWNAWLVIIGAWVGHKRQRGR
jgi:hypothetical protein